MSLKRCRSIGSWTVSVERADCAPKIAEVCVAVAGLDAFKGGAKLCVIGDGLRQDFDLSAESHDLRGLRRDGLADSAAKRLLFCVGKASACAHAE